MLKVRQTQGSFKTIQALLIGQMLKVRQTQGSFKTLQALLIGQILMIRQTQGPYKQCCGNESKGSESFCGIQIHNIFHESGSGSRSEPSPQSLPSSLLKANICVCIVGHLFSKTAKSAKSLNFSNIEKLLNFFSLN